MNPSSSVSRRRFLRRTFLAATGVLAGLRTWNATAGDLSAEPALTPDFDHLPVTIPRGFLGLSFETQRIADDDYLVPESTDLAELVRALGKTGVIRIGGNSSDRPSSTGLSAIGSRRLARFAEFLHATGWNLIYGLNAGSGTPKEAAAEAKLVGRFCGDRVLAFQFGNEPDLFRNNGHRPAGYDVGQYLGDWHRFAKAVKAKVPAAQFAGPDVCCDTSWLGHFAGGTRPDVRFLTHHYYAEGPAGSSSVSLSRLLNSSPDLLNRMRLAEAEAAPTRLPLRMTEINSVFGGGQAGISDCFAAVLWATNAVFSIAAAGWLGINLHSNQTAIYSPVVRGADGRFQARPVYHALRLFNRYGGRRMAALPGPLPAATARAFAVRGKTGERSIVLINLSADAPMRVRLPPLGGDLLVHTVEADRLTDSIFRFNGIPVSSDPATLGYPGAARSISGREQRSIEVNPASIQVLEIV
ncbi:MAG: hypothetical protein JO015_13965 [Verrucomicrobia bacterium]|nr:hypothetical protein [Verrucomicrobiota bacterium]